jgi:hypothetical protein
MAQVEEPLELLNNIIMYSMGNIVTIEKNSLESIVSCLQVLQAKVALLQNHTWLLHNTLE